jgi:hypothetical protein
MGEEPIYDMVGKLEEKCPAGRPRSKSVNNNKINLREIGVEGSCEHGNECSGSIKCWVVLE